MDEDRLLKLKQVIHEGDLVRYTDPRHDDDIPEGAEVTVCDIIKDAEPVIFFLWHGHITRRLLRRFTKVPQRDANGRMPR